jgi:hypothetical protein
LDVDKLVVGSIPVAVSVTVAVAVVVVVVVAVVAVVAAVGVAAGIRSVRRISGAGLGISGPLVVTVATVAATRVTVSVRRSVSVPVSVTVSVGGTLVRWVALVCVARLGLTLVHLAQAGAGIRGMGILVRDGVGGSVVDSVSVVGRGGSVSTIRVGRIGSDSVPGLGISGPLAVATVAAVRATVSVRVSVPVTMTISVSTISSIVIAVVAAVRSVLGLSNGDSAKEGEGENDLEQKTAKFEKTEVNTFLCCMKRWRILSTLVMVWCLNLMWYTYKLHVFEKWVTLKLEDSN